MIFKLATGAIFLTSVLLLGCATNMPSERSSFTRSPASVDLENSKWFTELNQDQRAIVLAKKQKIEAAMTASIDKIGFMALVDNEMETVKSEMASQPGEFSFNKSVHDPILEIIPMTKMVSYLDVINEYDPQLKKYPQDQVPLNQLKVPKSHACNYISQKCTLDLFAYIKSVGKQSCTIVHRLTFFPDFQGYDGGKINFKILYTQFGFPTRSNPSEIPSFIFDSGPCGISSP